jgi:hypothetical protein
MTRTCATGYAGSFRTSSGSLEVDRWPLTRPFIPSNLPPKRVGSLPLARPHVSDQIHQNLQPTPSPSRTRPGSGAQSLYRCGLFAWRLTTNGRGPSLALGARSGDPLVALRPHCLFDLSGTASGVTPRASSAFSAEHHARGSTSRGRARSLTTVRLSGQASSWANTKRSRARTVNRSNTSLGRGAMAETSLATRPVRAETVPKRFLRHAAQ